MSDDRHDNLSAHSDWKSIAIRWLGGQPATTVLLFIVIAMIAYGAWYGIPQHLKIIQDGYRASEERFVQESKQARDDYIRTSKDRDEQFTNTIDKLGVTFEKALDRSDGLMIRLETIRKELDETKREIDREKAK